MITLFSVFLNTFVLFGIIHFACDFMCLIDALNWCVVLIQLNQLMLRQLNQLSWLNWFCILDSTESVESIRLNHFGWFIWIGRVGSTESVELIKWITCVAWSESYFMIQLNQMFWIYKFITSFEKVVLINTQSAGIESSIARAAEDTAM